MQAYRKLTLLRAFGLRPISADADSDAYGVCENHSIPLAPVLTDAAYGNDSHFREGLSELSLPYVVGVQSSTTVWKPGEEPLPKKPRQRMGRPPKRLQWDHDHRPVSVKELALSWPAGAWKSVSWRQGTKQKLTSRFAAVSVRPAHRDYERSEPYPEEWPLIE